MKSLLDLAIYSIPTVTAHCAPSLPILLKIIIVIKVMNALKKNSDPLEVYKVKNPVSSLPILLLSRNHCFCVVYMLPDIFYAFLNIQICMCRNTGISNTLPSFVWTIKRYSSVVSLPSTPLYSGRCQSYLPK